MEDKPFGCLCRDPDHPHTSCLIHGRDAQKAMAAAKSWGRTPGQIYRNGVQAGVKATLILHFGARCMICGRAYREEELDLMHVKRKSQGPKAKPGNLGVDHPKNCLIGCRYCHDEQEKKPYKDRTKAQV